MTVAIVIIVYNLSTEIFLLQMEAIKKFCTDSDLTIEIVDNSTDPDKSSAISYHANELNLSYRETKAASVNSTDSHAFAANTAYEILKDKYDLFFFLDHDCIPVKPFSVEDILRTKVMAGLGQGQRKTYFWAGNVMFDNIAVDHNLIDFRPSQEYKLDTGGMLYKAIEKYGKENCVFFNESYHQNPNFNGKRTSYAMINNEMFIHFVNSSNWAGDERNEERINSLIGITKNKIEQL